MQKVSLLGSEKPLEWQQKGNQLIINLPQLSPEGLATSYAYVIKMEGLK